MDTYIYLAFSMSKFLSKLNNARCLCCFLDIWPGQEPRPLEINYKGIIRWAPPDQG